MHSLKLRQGAMEEITHRTLTVNGINMHVAEMGDAAAPMVLFLHGFPELWYSWRHQMVGLASLGYRVVAPDLRGYGGTDAPPDIGSYTINHLVRDLVELIGALGQHKVFVVGHDWGAILAWALCAMHPDLVRALVNTSVAYIAPLHTLRPALGEDHYIFVFQEPGEAESKFARVGVEKVMRSLLTYHNPTPPLIPMRHEGLGSFSIDDDTPLPSWLKEEDIKYYAETFATTGFTGGINYYRAMHLNSEIMPPWSEMKITVPVKFIVGDEDLAYYMPGTQEYVKSGAFKANVPLLEDIVVLKGVSHFLQQEKPEEITDLIYQFIKKF